MNQWIAGMDVGSTTVKAVVSPAGGGEIVWRDYRRHAARQAETVLDFLRRLESDLGITESNLQLVLTGSGGQALAPLLGAHYVSEVAAVALAVEKRLPDVQSVVELGGQDAKMIFFEDSPGGGRKKTTTMNDTCAGGTGAVIDKIAAKLQIGEQDLSRYRYHGVPLHPVAGKCGVFAESDINGLQKKGVPAQELLASLFEAIVLQNLSVLSRGRVLLPKVLLLGGPNYFLPGLREAWRTHIGRLWAERGVPVPEQGSAEEPVACPADGIYFAALGAVEFGREEAAGHAYAGKERLAARCAAGGGTKAGGLPGLRGSDSELHAFLDRYKARRSPVRGFQRGEHSRLFLGLDGGSTSTKAVLIDEWGAVRASAYCLSAGNPIEDCRVLARQLRTAITSAGAQAEVYAAAVTGYAKDVLLPVLHADAAIVETAAHARSGIAAMPGVDVIVDVGGQDIKIIALKHGEVKDFMLNTQCSAGNGYFLQSIAHAFGVPLQQFATRAFAARQMPQFSPGCAVFLQADIVNFQRQGWTPEEILAGLAAVLPKNIWQYVAKIPNPAKLGSRFLLQGGTQHNLAAVKAQVDYLHSHFAGSALTPEIEIHPHCGEAGAIGAALEARDLWLAGKPRSFPGLEAIEALDYHTITGETTRCNYCKNHCLRTFIDYQIDGAPGRFIVANCEKGAAADISAVRRLLAGAESNNQRNPNLIDFAARTVWTPPSPPLAATPARAWLPGRRKLRRQRRELRIAIPRVLYQYLYGGFFSAYLQSLGVPARNIIWSDFTSDAMYRAALGRGSIDPCFPSKTALAHVNNLLQKHFVKAPFQAIFMPMFDVLETHLEKTIGVNACPTVSTTPLVVRAAFRIGADEFARRGIAFLSPLLDLRDRPLLCRQMFECWDPLLGLDRGENQAAIEAAFKAQQTWMAGMRARTREVIEMLQREGRLGIVILGRPYHHDPGLNHGIPEEFQSRGYPVLSQSFLPADPDILDSVFGGDHPLDIDDVWQHSYSASTTHKVWAAKFVARHPNLIGVELSNFRCGHDAPAYQLIEDILESAGRPYFGFKDLDENKPAASIRLRVETIDYYLRQHRSRLIGRLESPVLEKTMEA
jgi:activator of 2-hydroxyglutaryl-CoA dehydratase/predicted nucleotide-binding protein (sugar kinase/HSP70/actin superfamily)